MSAATTEAVVLWGSNNIFMVQTPLGDCLECRLKGKVLKNVSDHWNPLAPGDKVLVETGDASQGMILERGERRNVLRRWNKKGSNAQAFAANVDLLVLVLSTESPPFRPRFADRLLVEAAMDGVPALICQNKVDQTEEPWVQERMEAYRSMGLACQRVSAHSGEGVPELRAAVNDRLVVFCGQSGVGKSSLVNLLCGSELATGEVSLKHNRGRHTTVVSRLLPSGYGKGIIDTPGVREFEVPGLEPEDLGLWYRDFEPMRGQCRFVRCTHSHETGCAVRSAAEEGRIHEDRYEGYLRQLEELIERRNRRYS